MRHLILGLLLWLTLTSVSCSATASVNLTAPLARESIRVSGSGTALPLVQKLAQAYTRQHPQTRFDFETGTNSGGAIQGVSKGTLDIAVANRPLNETESKEPLLYQAFARDAIVFVVKLPNPIERISTADLRAIYGGTITHWQQITDLDAPIIVLDRDAEESARKLVLLPLMGKQPVQARTVVLNQAGEMIRAIENTPNSIGYSSLGLINILQPKNVRVLTLDGVTPNGSTLASGVYSWSLTFGLVYRADAGTPRAFVDFVRGAEGTLLIEGLGYVAGN